MRLLRYINEIDPMIYPVPRTEDISLEKAIEIAMKKHKKTALSGLALGRDVDSNRGVRYTDPSKGAPRRSRNVSNYYTLLIDNHPKWKAFPKRSRGIICDAQADDYQYYVIPEDGAKIGICSDMDIWTSFSVDLDTMMYALDTIFSQLLEGSKHDKSIQSFKKACKEIDDLKKNEIEAFDDVLLLRHQSEQKHFFKKYLSSNKNLYDFLAEILDPKKNGFEIEVAGNIKGIPPGHEVWTDRPCLLLPMYGGYRLFMDEFKKAIKK